MVRLSAHADSLVLHFWDFFPEECPVFLGSFAHHSCLPRDFLGLLNRHKSALHKFNARVLLTTLLYFSQDETFCRSVITVAQRPSNHHITSPTSPSLFTNNRSSRVPSLVDILTSCVRAYLPGTSWTGSSPLWYSSRHLVDWNPPQEQWPVIVRVLPAASRLFHLPFLPGWMVYSRH